MTGEFDAFAWFGAGPARVSLAHSPDHWSALMPRLTRLFLVPVLAVSIGSAPGVVPARGDANPINHVVVLMQENRSFDHYFGRLHFEGQPRAEAEPPNA